MLSRSEGSQHTTPSSGPNQHYSQERSSSSTERSRKKLRSEPKKTRIWVKQRSSEGDDDADAFQVEVVLGVDTTINVLKDVIKAKKPVSCANVDSDAIKIFDPTNKRLEPNVLVTENVMETAYLFELPGAPDWVRAQDLPLTITLKHSLDRSGEKLPLDQHQHKHSRGIFVPLVLQPIPFLLV